MQVILVIMAKAALFLVFLSYVCFVFRPDSMGDVLDCQVVVKLNSFISYSRENVQAFVTHQKKKKKKVQAFVCNNILV